MHAVVLWSPKSSPCLQGGHPLVPVPGAAPRVRHVLDRRRPVGGGVHPGRAAAWQAAHAWEDRPRSSAQDLQGMCILIVFERLSVPSLLLVVVVEKNASTAIEH